MFQNYMLPMDVDLLPLPELDYDDVKSYRDHLPPLPDDNDDVKSYSGHLPPLLDKNKEKDSYHLPLPDEGATEVFLRFS